MTIKKIIYPGVALILICLAFGFGIWVGAVKYSYHVEQPDGLDFSLFWDAYNKLRRDFVDPSKITSQKVLYGAIEGMTNSLGDPYTEFFDPERAKRFQQDLSGSFEGIGVEVGIKNSLLTVIAPLKGTPGQRAGLMSGDIILKIDGEDATSITTSEAVGLIRGPKGTPVVLNIMREGWMQTKDIKITRATIQVPALKWSMKEENVAYLEIYQFGDTISSEFELAALQILRSPAEKIILDLRDNPGGYLGAAQNLAGFFLERDHVVTIEDFGEDEDPQIYKTEGNSNLINYPVVVLINQGSASASEILAGALRDNRGVKLIGVKSFGKGSVQEVVDLVSGSFLKITIAKWLTPNGESISDVGLTPDIKVELTDEDFKQERDPQLEKALEIVNGLK